MSSTPAHLPTSSNSYNNSNNHRTSINSIIYSNRMEMSALLSKFWSSREIWQPYSSSRVHLLPPLLSPLLPIWSMPATWTFRTSSSNININNNNNNCWWRYKPWHSANRWHKVPKAERLRCWTQKKWFPNSWSNKEYSELETTQPKNRARFYIRRSETDAGKCASDWGKCVQN